MTATDTSIERPIGPGAVPWQGDERLRGLFAAAFRGVDEGLCHVHSLPSRRGVAVDWPAWADPRLVERLTQSGVTALWRHQRAAADLAWNRRNVVIATGTASGKSLAYQLPVVTRLLATSASLRPTTALYIAPTKALAADQLRALAALHLTGLRAATCDGDTPDGEREWARRHANLLLTNPDMLHRTLLPGHRRWSAFLRELDYVVLDECHSYRGIFGSHVAQVLRRLRRLCRHYGADPTFVLASATTAEPAYTAERLTGLPTEIVTDDASPAGERIFALYEPPITEGGERGPSRRSATAVSASMLSNLVSDGHRTVAFVRSRAGAETVATAARDLLADVSPQLVRRVAAYRAGYLPEERRTLERQLHSGAVVGLASTSALELGVDIAGLDAIVIAGYPGTLASLWQQSGRAGRDARGGLTVFVARDDPLDAYLVRHPEAVFDRAVETTVLDPANPYVLAPHLCAAAAELPLDTCDEDIFGPALHTVLPALEQRTLLRRRPGGWFWTRRDRACDLADLRGTGGPPVRIVEQATGRLLGTCDRDATHTSLHDGAVYVHQGRTFVVDRLDLDEGVALVEERDPGYTTWARDSTDLTILGVARQHDLGDIGLGFGEVEVTRRVVGYLLRRRRSGEVLGERALDLPERRLRTKAVWWTLTDAALATSRVAARDVAGAVHAAEHAAIGLLPLFATCDRWDIGGVSTAAHPQTGRATVVVYDGCAGGAGFAERGFGAAEAWLRATLTAIRDCECSAGCPACVQSPKCGNGNEPLDKAAAARLLHTVVTALTSYDG